MARLDARLDPDRPAPVALALSGGGDSMALLHLAAEWARRRRRPLLALTIDHRLSPSSADWTRFAGDAAARAGALWRPLIWDEARDGPGVSARARAARHRLLATAAREAGARVILTGHTADDVREGDWMRAEGSTLGRLRDWSPSPVWPEGRELMLMRPLLDEGRAALRAWLGARGQAWIDDPANADPRFARSRARAALAGTGEGPAAAPRADAPASPVLLDESVAWAGVLTLGRETLDAAGLGAALLSAGGGDTPPRGERLARLHARLIAGEAFASVLAGARVEARGERVRIMREPGERRRREPSDRTLRAGHEEVWDGRFTLGVAEGGWRAEASEGRLSQLSPRDRARLAQLPPAARAVLPVLVRDDGRAPILAWRVAETRALAPRRLALRLGETTQERDLFQPFHGETPPTDLFSRQD